MSLPVSLADFNGNSRESGTQINFQTCPVCSDQRFKCYVDPITGKWFCFAHQGGGCVEVEVGRDDWVARLKSQHADRYRVDTPIDWPEVDLPPWEPLSKKASRYLQARGIDSSLARALGLVEMQDSLRIIIPYTGPSGRIIYWSARAYSDFQDGPKYLGASGRHPLYVLPNWHPSDELVVVEGALDAISVRTHTGRHVAALGGKSLPRYLRPELLAMVKSRVTLILDADAPLAAVRIKHQLPRRLDLKIVKLPDGEDPASLGAGIKELICKRINVVESASGTKATGLS